MVNSSHRLDILSGVAGSNAFTTWYFGDDGNIVTLRRVKPLWQDKPDSATLQHYHTMTIGGSDTTGAAPTMGSLGRFDLIKAARWHKCTVTTSGDAELTGVAFDAVSSGEE